MEKIQLSQKVFSQILSVWITHAYLGQHFMHRYLCQFSPNNAQLLLFVFNLRIINSELIFTEKI